MNNENNEMLDLLNRISNKKLDYIESETGIWNSDGDINPLDELKDFKDYDGFTWNGYVSIKKEDSYKLGLLSKQDYYKYSKAIVPKLIMDSGFNINNIKWYACLHLDSSKNYNFHFFFMEIKKTKYKYSDRLIPKSAIKRFKSNALNYLINRNDILKLKDELFMNIIKNIQIKNLTSYNKSFYDSINKKLEKLYKQLPKEYRLQYNSPNLNKCRPLINSIIYDILSEPSISNEYYKYIEKLYDIDFQNKEYYGYSKEDNYINNQINKLYSRIGNDILSNYKNYKSELFLENQKEFLSKNIFKLNLKSNNNITEEEKFETGIGLYKLASLINLNETQTRRLIKNWYFKSEFDYQSFDEYFNKLHNVDNTNLSTKDFYKLLNNMGISNFKYQKLKDSFYKKNYVYNYMIKNALEHIKYENERIGKEIVNSLSDELGY